MAHAVSQCEKIAAGVKAYFTAEVNLQSLARPGTPAVRLVNSVSVSVEKDPKMEGGLSGQVNKYIADVHFTKVDGTLGSQQLSLLQKTFSDDRIAGSQQLGLAREGIFYRTAIDVVANGKADPGRHATGSDVVTPHRGASSDDVIRFFLPFAQGDSPLFSYLPPTYDADGDMVSGHKSIVMRNMVRESISVSFLMDAGGSPLNWGKVDVIAGEKEEKFTVLGTAVPTELDVVRAIADVGAALHAPLWHEAGAAPSAVGTSGAPTWLRGGWFLEAFTGTSSSQAAWESSVSFVKGLWEEGKTDGKIAAIGYDARLIKLVEASFAATTWATCLEDVRRRSWTLVHGDFHPGNMLWRTGSTPRVGEPSIVLVDWEVVGWGNGPQEIAQFFISHSAATARRGYYMEVLQRYVDGVNRRRAFLNAQHGSQHDGTAAVKPLVMSEVLDDYIHCGLGRWLFVIPFLVKHCPVGMNKYWHDQVLTFAIDHGILDDHGIAAAAKLPIVRA